MRGSVQHVRRSLARLQEALQGSSPYEIGEALPVLREAITAVEETGRRLAGGEVPEHGLKPALIALTCEIGMAQQLADQGLALYRSRAMEVAALAGGYGATGLPAPVPTGVTIKLEG